MKKKILVSVSMILLLAGCASPETYPDSTDSISEEESYSESGGFKANVVQLPDGREVICVRKGSAGISCDWDNAQ